MGRCHSTYVTITEHVAVVRVFWADSKTKAHDWRGFIWMTGNGLGMVYDGQSTLMKSTDNKVPRIARHIHDIIPI